jgi:enoyl-CoA hydratase/carnithine racemase
MNFETLKLNQDGGVLTVTLSNPPVNLISDQMIQELFQLSGGLMRNPDVHVVVLDSADPDFFLAHMDLNAIIAAETDPAKQSRYPDMNALQALGLSWQNLPQVKIVKVAGRCRGGGLELALAMDMRFAGESAVFCAPEAAGGFVPAGGGTTRTMLAAGPARAMEILLSARDFSAEEAERYGIINRCLPDDELDAYVATLAQRIALRSPAVVGMLRKVFGEVSEPVVEPLFAAFAAENDAIRAGMAGDEMGPMMQLHLDAGQARELELDLPATMDGFIAKRLGK